MHYKVFQKLLTLSTESVGWLRIFTKTKKINHNWLYIFFQILFLYNFTTTVFQLLSHVWLIVTTWTVAWKTPLSFTISQSLLKFMSAQLVMLSISSSATLFSSCLQSFPTPGPFPMSWFFASGGQSIGVSSSASVLPMNIQGWFPLAFTGLISL